MLKTSTIQAVRDLAIVDVIGRYIDLKKKGANYLAHSPFTDEKTPSFTVFTRNNNFKCFSSGAQGDGITFVMLYTKEVDFITAVREIASDHGIPIEEEDLTPEQKEKRQKEYDEKKEVLKVMEYAKSHFLNNKIPARWRQMRKFNSEILLTFQVGYGSGKTTLVDDAIKAEFSKNLLKKAGLLRNVLDPASTDKEVWSIVDAYADRVIFPILDVRGNTVAFTARYNGQDEKAPKYINSPSGVWEKGRNLYGLYQAIKTIREADKAYLVEGPTDVIRMHTKELDNTVCPCGTALTDEQCKLLYRFTDRVTIVPDNDLEKKDNPGLKALERNARLLLKHGFFVSVLIPGSAKSNKNTDPDSFLGNMRTDEQFSKWMDREEGYIEDYLCRVCMTMAEGTADQKFAAVKLMADTIEAVKEVGYRNALYDNVAKVWPYFKKEYRPLKRESLIVSTEVENLKREAREEYFKNKFIEEDGKYIAWQKGGVKVELSDFTMKVIFTVTFINGGDVMRKSILAMVNEFNYRTLAVISTDDFCSSITFKKIVRRRGEFYWYGKDNNLDDVSKRIFLNCPNAVELDRMGWNSKYQFLVWSNGIYFNRQFHQIDKYGLIQREKLIESKEQFLKLRNGSQLIKEGKLQRINNATEYLGDLGEAELLRLIDEKRISKVDFFYLPFGTALQIDTGENDKGKDFKKDIKLIIPEKDQEWTFDRWAEKIAELYGTNGWIMICYYLASIFRDIIYEVNNDWFPMLFFFGRPQSGKSTAAKSIYHMFGEVPQKDGINLSSGSTPTALGRYMDTLSNVPGIFNEYKNHIPERMKEALKGIADGSGRIQGTRSAKGTESIAPNSGALVCGQELPSSEKALMERIIPLEFIDKNRVDIRVYDDFIAIENSGIFRWITCKISEYRDIFKDAREEKIKLHYAIREKCIEHNIKSNDRLLKNACSILLPLKLFLEKTDLKFPFTYDEFVENLMGVLKMSSTIQAESDEVERFFTTLMAIVGNPSFGVIEGQDFKIKNTGSKKLLYLRFKACYGKYEKAATNPMGTPDLSRYLQTHKCYIESTRKAQFGGRPTSAFIFDYDYLLERDIDLQKPKIISQEDLQHQEREKQAAFTNIITGLELDTKYKTSDLIAKLSKQIDDHIPHDEFVQMCMRLNEETNGIVVQKHDDDATIIYVESSNGKQGNIPF